MIDVGLAQKFIEQVVRYTDYNVNIMDENGIIIASRDAWRIGTFHEVAYLLARGEAGEMMEIGEKSGYEGVQNGVNMIVELDGKPAGVIGITGNPEEVRPVALVIRMAVETMLRYESRRVEMLRRQNKKERFAELLTGRVPADAGELKTLSEALGYHEELLRIPLLLKTDSAASQKTLIDLIKGSAGHGSEDISFALSEEYVLVFKTIAPAGDGFYSDYRYEIGEYLSGPLRLFRREGLPLSCYVGSMQREFAQYPAGYGHCRWMEAHLKLPDGGSAWFYEHVGEYLADQLPRRELAQVFDGGACLFDEKFREEYLEIMGALITCNYNLVDAAKKLYLHKNTFTYRYNKIRERLAVNPQAGASERRLAEALYLYFLRMRH
ncbi:MAG: sugar diacid recognition domain-containing protein [Eubacteriales bacterium]|nr:sugar diacid recognition domain-containing protein [Eubacteriales bacterium]